MRHRTATFGSLLTLAVMLASSSAAHAMCNVIPHAGGRFRGALGSTDRPFAGPGQLIELQIGPSICTTNSLPLQDFNGDGTIDEGDVIVTLFFKPLGNNDPKHAVVLATECSNVDLSSSCGGIPTSATICIDADRPGRPPGLYVDAQASLVSVRFPSGICVGGSRPELPCEAAADCGGGGQCETQAPPRPLTGPLTIAVTAAAQTVSGANPKPPCQLAGQPCRQVSQGQVACVDELYPLDGTCNTDEPDDTFPSFTALPPPNDFQHVCTHSSLDPPCNIGTMSSEVRFALDTRGDALVPIYWNKILLQPPPVTARIVRGSTAVPATAAGSERIRIPRDGFAESYTLRGTRLPALFEPQVSSERPNELTLFGTVDADHSVLRIPRRGRSNSKYWQCSGGQNDGLPCRKNKHCDGGSCIAASVCQDTGAACTKDKQCPGSECGGSLFSFASRVQDGIGPVRITRAPREGKICDATGSGAANDGAKCDPGDVCTPAGVCVDYRASADEQIPLGRVESSEGLYAFVLDESLVQNDVNGDGDTIDQVLTVRDNSSGTLLPIGVGLDCTPENGCPGDAACPRADGRAVVMLPRAGHTFPALSLGGDVIAFIEDCEAQSPSPGSCQGDVLRVFRKMSCPEPMLQETTTGDLIPAQEQVIDDWALQVTDRGKVFFRDTCGVLQVLDGQSAPGSAPQPLAPAVLVATADDKAAFLLPEQPVSGPACSAPLSSGDLNGDADLDDAVVHLWIGGSKTAENLRCAATDLDMSSEWVAALVSERQQAVVGESSGWRCPGPGGEGDLNGDGDCEDDVVHVAAVVPHKASVCAEPTWRNLGQSGRELGVSEGAIAYLRPESNDGQDLNNDGDRADEIMQLYFARTKKSSKLSMAAEGYVLGELTERQGSPCHVLAFHTSEKAQSQNLNDLHGDIDQADTVLQLVDLVKGERQPEASLRNTQQAVTECQWMVCDPREPYRIEESAVRFLTHECEQGGPVTTGCASPPGGTDLDGDGAADRLVMQLLEVCDPALFASPAAPLSLTAFRMDERVESFAMAGRCVEDLQSPCRRDPKKGVLGCPSGTWCEESEKLRRWSWWPLGFRPADTCHRDQGVCFTSKDCPAALRCELDYTTVFFGGDLDRDGVKDAIDNCPDEQNRLQTDSDEDGVGDVCDRNPRGG